MSGNSFGAPSTPLAEAVKAPEITEYPPEELGFDIPDEEEQIFQRYNIKRGFINHYAMGFPDKKYILKENLTNHYFEWLLKRLNREEVEAINSTHFTKGQITAYGKTIEAEIYDGDLINEKRTPTAELLDYNAELIKKNKHLEGLLKDTINDKGTKTLKAIQTTNTILQEDNDKLYKEKAELQKERDKAINDLKITMKEGFNEERDQAIKDMLDLLKHIVDIFVEQGIKAKLTDSEIELVEMLYKK